MKLIKNIKGMTVVEILVSLAVLGVVSVGTMTFFTDSFKFQSKNQEQTKAQTLAEETLEHLRNNNGIYGDLNVKGNKTSTTVNEGYKTTLSVIKSGEINTAVDAGLGTLTKLELYEITVNVEIPEATATAVGTINGQVRVETNDVKIEDAGEYVKVTVKYISDDISSSDLPYTQMEYIKKNERTYIIVNRDNIIPDADGYTCVAWRDNLNNEYVNGGKIEVNVSEETEIVLKARWEESDTEIPTYMLTVVNNNATIKIDYEAGEFVTLDATIPVGYTWVGWESSNPSLLGNQAERKVTIKMPEGDITMTARYE